jgi:hypothetical protein
MEQYISKSALVAEIEKRIKETESMQPKFDQFWAGQISAFKGVLKILDTLETKEVNVELNSFDAIVCKIGSVYLKEMDRDAITKVLEPYKNGDKVRVIIKAQKEK